MLKLKEAALSKLHEQGTIPSSDIIQMLEEENKYLGRHKMKTRVRLWKK